MVYGLCVYVGNTKFGAKKLWHLQFVYSFSYFPTVVPRGLRSRPSRRRPKVNPHRIRLGLPTVTNPVRETFSCWRRRSPCSGNRLAREIAQKPRPWPASALPYSARGRKPLPSHRFPAAGRPAPALSLKLIQLRRRLWLAVMNLRAKPLASRE
jgi:hypothetical protein